MPRPAHVVIAERTSTRSTRTEVPASGLYAVAPAHAEPSAFATHDAKNMLGVLRANLTWLREAIGRGAGRKELEEVLDDLDTSVDRLHEIVRQAMPLRKCGPSAITPVPALVEVSALLQAVHRQVHRRAAAKGVTLLVQIHADARAQLDEALFERVLINLVDNALRFSPAGSTVCIACDVVDERVEIFVTDEGPGVDKAQCDRIFEPYFTTAADSPRSESENSGLGLAFCRAVARAHGGDVRVEQGARGGCFVVSLPLAR